MDNAAGKTFLLDRLVELVPDQGGILAPFGILQCRETGKGYKCPDVAKPINYIPFFQAVVNAQDFADVVMGIVVAAEPDLDLDDREERPLVSFRVARKLEILDVRG